MSTELRRVETFPSLSLASHSGGLPVEVSLIAQLGVGGGDALVRSAGERQRGHVAFVDALDEPSVRIGAMDLDHGDASSLYTFSVGAAGHPFHRHAGTACSRRCRAAAARCCVSPRRPTPQLAEQPSAFVRALRHVQIHTAGLPVHRALWRRHLAPVPAAARRGPAPGAVRAVLPHQ